MVIQLRAALDGQPTTRGRRMRIPSLAELRQLEEDRRRAEELSAVLDDYCRLVELDPDPANFAALSEEWHRTEGEETNGYAT
jgi:hypothetical protein